MPRSRDTPWGAKEPTSPARLPDGKHFACNTSAGGGTFVARSDGSGQKQIVRDAYDPTWSPNGEQIAFVRNVTPKNPEIFVIDADGTGERRLTHHPGFDGDPAWSRS